MNEIIFDDPTIAPVVFPGGETHVNITQPIPETSVIAVRTGDMSTLAMAVMASKRRAADGGVTSLVVAYLPGARQDNHLLDSEGSLYADLINAGGFHRVYIADPHSTQVADLIQRVVVCDDLVIEQLTRFATMIAPDAVIAPDHGAHDRADRAARNAGVPLITMEKHRNPDTGAITGIEVADETGIALLTDLREPRLLVVDDICDGGGTFAGIAEAIHSHNPNARMSLWVTHGIFSGHAHDTLKVSYSPLACTDSFHAQPFLGDGGPVTYVRPNLYVHKLVASMVLRARRDLRESR